MKSIKVKNWKDFLAEDHWDEIARMFPLSPEEELTDLASSIKSTGLIEPVVLYKNKVLDGRNRLRACDRAEVVPSFVEWETKDAEDGTPLSWALAKNGARRTMSGSQKAYVALQAIHILYGVEGLGEGQRWGDKRIVIADKVGVGRHYVSDIRTIAKSKWVEANPQILLNIRDGVETITSVLRKIAFWDTGLEVPANDKECAPGQVAHEFFKLLPRHSVEAAFLDAQTTLQGLRHSDLTDLQKYWARLDSEYKFWDPDSRGGVKKVG